MRHYKAMFCAYHLTVQQAVIKVNRQIIFSCFLWKNDIFFRVHMHGTLIHFGLHAFGRHCT